MPYYLRRTIHVTRYREVNPLSPIDAAYIAGIVDGEGTIISISSTERAILDFVRERIGAGKITSKKTAKSHHAPGLTYAIWNRQARRFGPSCTRTKASEQCQVALLALRANGGRTPP